ncbi:MAG: hypothetical protein Fur003_0300 [Candidatus Dojkabacteria bacterium]
MFCVIYYGIVSLTESKPNSQQTGPNLAGKLSTTFNEVVDKILSLSQTSQLLPGQYLSMQEDPTGRNDFRITEESLKRTEITREIAKGVTDFYTLPPLSSLELLFITESLELTGLDSFNSQFISFFACIDCYVALRHTEDEEIFQSRMHHLNTCLYILNSRLKSDPVLKDKDWSEFLFLNFELVYQKWFAENEATLSRRERIRRLKKVKTSIAGGLNVEESLT